MMRCTFEAVARVAAGMYAEGMLGLVIRSPMMPMLGKWEGMNQTSHIASECGSTVPWNVTGYEMLR